MVSLSIRWGYDNEHANAILEDPRDNSIVVSIRHQDAVIKFTRNGQLKWILGPHANWGAQWQKYLLTPVGTPFEWQYAQHAPELTPQGTLLVYDDGNYRASPFERGTWLTQTITVAPLNMTSTSKKCRFLKCGTMVKRMVTRFILKP